MDSHSVFSQNSSYTSKSLSEKVFQFIYKYIFLTIICKIVVGSGFGANLLYQHHRFHYLKN